MTAAPIRILASLLLTPLAAVAGTSADYSVAPDILDAGGERGTSPSYALDFSAAPGGAGAGGPVTLDSGFPGQLEAMTGIVLYLTPGALAETASGQLSAELVTDTGVRTPLDPGDLTWSVWSGPLSAVTGGGAVTAGVVPADSRAAVRATGSGWSGILFFSVLDTIPDNYLAYAGDGLPDDWQARYFGTGYPSAGPSQDADGDGYDNLFEYRAGLDPADPRSVLRMTLTGTPGGGHQVSFSPRNQGTTYTLMGSNDLSLWEPVTGPVLDAGSTRTITDPAGAGRRRFYSLSVQRLP